MEQKTKKKFNIIDVIVIILLVAAVVFAGWKLSGKEDSDSSADMTKVTYTVKVEGVPAELYENCQEHLPSPLMASGKLLGGEIQTVRKEPFLVLSPSGDWVEDPEHVTLYFTAETETPSGDVMTTKVGEQEVRVGKTDYILKSEYIEFSRCTIVDVSWEK